jgi:hypothetical protein
MQAQYSNQAIPGAIPSRVSEAFPDPMASRNFFYQAATVVAILLFLLTF